MRGEGCGWSRSCVCVWLWIGRAVLVNICQCHCLFADHTSCLLQRANKLAAARLPLSWLRVCNDWLFVHVCAVCCGECFTFSLGGYFERCRALPLAVAVVAHNPEAIFGVWHQVLDGDLHLAGTAGVDHSLPDVIAHKHRYF